MCNNTTGLWRDEIELNCAMLGVGFHYVEGPFNMARIFNLGTQMTRGEYIAYCSADMIYFENWFENIVELWEENPEYFLLCNYSFDTRNMPCVKHDTIPERRIVHSGNPSAGLSVFKRSSNYVWDEQFPFWELDADVFYHLDRNNLKAGCCLNARADHMIEGMRRHIDYRTNFGLTDVDHEFFREPRKRLERKWNLAPVT